MGNLRAPFGKCLVAVEDPFEDKIDVIEGMESVEMHVALDYAEKHNANRRSRMDNIYWVYDYGGFIVNTVISPDLPR